MTDLAQGATQDALFKRQTGFFAPQDHPQAQATFVGVGGIGSFAAFATAKLGMPKLTLIDFDNVEEHNVPNQFSPRSRVGEPKVEALAAEIQAHMGDAVAVTALNTDLSDHTYVGPVVSGLDSMKARNELWEKIKFNPLVPVYLDGRIAGPLMILYAVNPSSIEDCERYERTLHSDEDAEEAPCTERGLIDVGFSIGALVSRALRLHYTDKELKPVTYMNVNSLELRQGDWIK